jgi:membrane protease subunit HflK
MRWSRVLLLLALLAYLATGVAQVGPDERGMVRRFGQVVARPGPGLWIGLPWGFDRFDRIQVRNVRQLTVGYVAETAADAPGTPPGQLLTGDQNLVNARLIVEYAVNETELDDFLVHQDQVPAVLSRETEALAAEWAGRSSVDQVLAGRADLTRWIAARLPERLQVHKLGIAVQRVSVDGLAAPEDVRDSFEAVNQAQNSIRTRKNNADREADRLLNDANAMKVRLETETESYRDEKTRLAQSDAEAFRARLEQYQRLKGTNPDFLAAIWREEVGKLLVDLKARGRIEILDDFIGPDGLDITQFIPTKKR